LESYSKDVFTPEYIIAIKEITEGVLKDQSATKLKALRENLLKLLVNGVPADLIIVIMSKELCKVLKDENVQREIVKWASFYDSRAQNGSKALFHLEALIARFMFIIAESRQQK
jgi:replication factor C subunit 3/5